MPEKAKNKFLPHGRGKVRMGVEWSRYVKL